MNPADIQFVAKPRPPYQAIDAGIAMWRQWWGSLSKIWLAMTLPLMTPLVYLFPDALWPVFLLWWLKPVYERALLHYCSRAAFNDHPTVWQSVRAGLQIFNGSMFKALTIRRLSPSRSFNAPVHQLEGQEGAQRSTRINVLGRMGFAGTAGWLTLACVHIEWIIQWSIFAVIAFFTPENITFDPIELFSYPYLNALTLYLAWLIIAPIYVCSGFALYLNRRTALEGWDIELLFKQISTRTAKQQAHPLTVKHWAAICLSLCLCANPFSPADAKVVLPQPAQAQRFDSAEQAQQQIEAILSGDDFVRKELISTPRWPDFEQPETEQPEAEQTDPEEIESMRSFLDALIWLGNYFKSISELAALMEWVLWFIALSILVALLLNYRRVIRLFSGISHPKSHKPPTTMFSMDVRQESLPADIGAEAAALWASNQARAAIALLYRATLSHLLHRFDVVLRPGFTENDCLDAAKQPLNEADHLYFSQLTIYWQLTAYAHQPPPVKDFYRLIEQWNHHLGNSAPGVTE